MNEEIAGKTIADVEVRQPKNLNMPVSEFAKTAKGKIVNNVSSKGKWLFLRLYPGYLMLMNVGMGAELLYFTRDQNLPGRYQFKLAFLDETGFTTNFWWFGYVHLIPEKALTRHRLTAQLGISPLDEGFTLEYFKKLLAGRKAGIKSFLLDQKNITGIGNVQYKTSCSRLGCIRTGRSPLSLEKK